ncbi:MAG TPA: 2'-5' RNA ligase family protein [Candidatus Dormibacteraeota bacterium]
MIPPRASALIVPVPQAEWLVGPWREQYDDSARTGVPAHVTLLYPFLPPEEITPADLERLRSFFATVPATRFRLTAARRFSRGVLYLAPEPEKFFQNVTARIWRLYPDHPPYGGVFQHVVPHLTVSQVEDHALLDQIEAVVTKGLPIEAEATEAWLMVEADENRWQPGHRFALGSTITPEPADG